MALKLMYITNDPVISTIAQNAGVDRIFVDMEYIGKSDRQCGMDTVQSHHTIDDIIRIKRSITSAQLLVRCNPIHEKSEYYLGSKDEIEAIVEAGADIIMLPYFKTVQEVCTFLSYVNGRCKTMLLVETPEAVDALDEILDIPGIDEVHIGLNDLSLGYGKRFLFELLADGTVEQLCHKCSLKGILYGFGGIASLGKGLLPAEYVIQEHYRLGSSAAILSRSFCDANTIQDLNRVRQRFIDGIQKIRAYEKQCLTNPQTYGQNHRDVIRIVGEILEQKATNKI